MRVVHGELSFKSIFENYLDVSSGRSYPTMFACPELFDKIKLMICGIIEKKYGREFSPDTQVIVFQDSYIVRDANVMDGQIVFRSLVYPERSIRLVVESR